jgi:glycosyltransferase involved in cell wall biosynthesis
MHEQRINGICFVTYRGSVPYGMDASIQKIAPYLERVGVNLTFLSVGNRSDLAVSLLKERKLLTKRQDFYLFNALSSLVRPISRTAWLIAKATGRPRIVFFHESALQVERLQATQRVHFDRIVRDKDVAFLANSSFTSQQLLDCFQRESRVVQNCAFVDRNLLPNPRNFNPSLVHRRVLMIGTFLAHKGVNLFLETAIACCTRDPAITFVWVGEGVERQKWIEVVRANGFEERILLPGFINNPQILLREASLLFMTSVRESFSMVTAEAMAFGREILMIKGVGGPEEITEGRAEVLERPDPELAAERILKILDRPFRLRTDLMDLWSQKYTPERHADRLANAIRREVLGATCESLRA